MRRNVALGRSKEEIPQRLMSLGRGIPSCDAFSDLIRALDPQELHDALPKLVSGWSGNIGEAVAMDGMVPRRSFRDAATTRARLPSPVPPGSRPVPGEFRNERDRVNAGAAGTARPEGSNFFGGRNARAAGDGRGGRSPRRRLRRSLKGSRETLRDDVRFRMANTGNAE
ncbi:MAG: hypothetical protein OXI87_13285 [Albidovulum sp.]|nr:hypothetical protein [Albidovulum sp.]